MNGPDIAQLEGDAAAARARVIAAGGAPRPARNTDSIASAFRRMTGALRAATFAHTTSTPAVSNLHAAAGKRGKAKRRARSKAARTQRRRKR